MNHFDGQLFSPPYLFQGARPTVSVDGLGGVGAVSNGQEITVTSGGALSIIAIIRHGSTTHAIDTDQRRIELCGPVAGACGGGGANTVTIPVDPGVAIPGAARPAASCVELVQSIEWLVPGSHSLEIARTGSITGGSNYRSSNY